MAFARRRKQELSKLVPLFEVGSSTFDVHARGGKIGGPDRDRTGDLMNAIHARSQLRYWPTRPLGETSIIRDLPILDLAEASA